MTSDIQSKSAQCNDAFHAYAALKRLQIAEPRLARNGYFTALVETAYARFRVLYEAL
jgi:hypothetical protein